ncbi:protein ORANGE-LIKE, chloroplastic [Coffea eugenioides]|uniref:Protein ORANGE-LIKE, chloroplastic-like n=1 Tax=Coffea arabica TaxID=13443 RepID=A0A6P6U9L3_COFAR|nr:protein ORANGE-LIKE, chloroplastic-like [Coffea arabica]XP_027087120.1 protein ORANGE-LIKE, chloroplastic-like [Coffea arabica]XP_027087121.1 protein ORANGE-LIKE, chloroplastic-like [Coffea arabica]XP_027087122.1 protein ORANGE-LIKE, chloroplastic-like [Coffea arabica]XP_027087123.1 protein ORANGE-LIKE, chloroplastic-like [Coffea arabica]XP_027087124.1 protein ORANGE-LIKE, chloroplastic-like [Coffea arabica]XP_027087130.1 protein ORANGE-LIKE, chloroplastic-like [Coffea arabica]XP_02708713
MPGKGFLKALPILATSAAVILGGAFTISAVTSSLVRYGISKKKEKYGRPCRACKGRGFYPCKLCKASGTIQWSPLYDPLVINPCLCPTCDGLKVQHCLNCLGSGFV